MIAVPLQRILTAADPHHGNQCRRAATNCSPIASVTDATR
jgi:hypothetical protein